MNFELGKSHLEIQAQARELASGIAPFAAEADEMSEVHPGVLATEIWDRNSGLVMRLFQWWKRFMDPPSVGGEAVSRLVLDPEVPASNGGYFDELEPTPPTADAQDENLARALWNESRRAVELENEADGAAVLGEDA